MPKRAGRAGKQADKPTKVIERLYAELQDLITLRGMDAVKASERSLSYFFNE